MCKIFYPEYGRKSRTFLLKCYIFVSCGVILRQTLRTALISLQTKRLCRTLVYKDLIFLNLLSPFAADNCLDVVTIIFSVLLCTRLSKTKISDCATAVKASR